MPVVARPRKSSAVSTRSPSARLTVTVGRDERLRKASRRIRLETGREFEIVGWTDQLPRLLFGKSSAHQQGRRCNGAGSDRGEVSDDLSQVVPGQEEGNARLIDETRSGAIATDAGSDHRRGRSRPLPTTRGFGASGRTTSAGSAVPRASLEIAELLLGVGEALSEKMYAVFSRHRTLPAEDMVAAPPGSSRSGGSALGRPFRSRPG